MQIEEPRPTPCRFCHQCQALDSREFIQICISLIEIFRLKWLVKRSKQNLQCKKLYMLMLMLNYKQSTNNIYNLQSCIQAKSQTKTANNEKIFEMIVGLMQNYSYQKRQLLKTCIFKLDSCSQSDEQSNSIPLSKKLEILLLIQSINTNQLYSPIKITTHERNYILDIDVDDGDEEMIRVLRFAIEDLRIESDFLHRLKRCRKISFDVVNDHILNNMEKFLRFYCQVVPKKIEFYQCKKYFMEEKKSQFNGKCFQILHLFPQFEKLMPEQDIIEAYLDICQTNKPREKKGMNSLRNRLVIIGFLFYMHSSYKCWFSLQKYIKYFFVQFLRGCIPQEKTQVLKKYQKNMLRKTYLTISVEFFIESWAKKMKSFYKHIIAQQKNGSKYKQKCQIVSIKRILQQFYRNQKKQSIIEADIKKGISFLQDLRINLMKTCHNIQSQQVYPSIKRCNQALYY